MAHYVFQRNNGYGDYDYIRSFDTMEITDYKEYAAQIDDKYLAYIDIPYMNSLGFYPIRITSLALRIEPLLLFTPLIRGFRPLVKPRAPRARGALPGPRPIAGPMPAPRPAPRPRVVAPRPRVAAPRPAVKPAPVGRTTRRAAGPAVPPPPKGGRGGRGPGVR
ncbi:MAG: hypothetical protein IKR85_02745 [Clostridia bacterium]|nr:hypothetical protein [Clostridia bacterium]